ncbi:Protein NirG [Magnetospirillum sp. LM-5]|uniref:Lrp/AsnC family transcriptional regulator n=1 Tax=Magnetospirillum sp. LM-5 TaxID=2681466 RepID=UPI00137CB3EA|nr:AsnC family transcriptional regulator [Magnetospirillum sp. LM-5]CAA7611380.1 Protein NirG [Magnetospirillum sp. LM-5]
MIDDTDRAIINALQGGFPVCDRPFRVAAELLGLTETDLITRIARLRADGVLSRFGPMYNADRFGGHNTLVAIEVPEDRFDEVAAIVNAFPEVAHNYARAHRLNMWFVVAAQSRAEVDRVLTEVEAATGLTVHDMPKQREFHVGLRFEA